MEIIRLFFLDQPANGLASLYFDMDVYRLLPEEYTAKRGKWITRQYSVSAAR
jgi:hypothetical protein